MKNIYRGSCHCQNIKFEFQSNLDFSEFTPRACDCDFCLKHGAAYVSDPHGMLHIEIADKTRINQYRQGSETADFLICRNCGVCAAVTFSDEETVYAGINSRTINENHRFRDKEIVSPKKLDKVEKIKRWKKVWFPDVLID